MRKTMKYDPGSEMACHRDLATANGIQAYFADPYSPWQRGSNLNANGLVREYLSKGSDLSGTSQDELNVIINRLNERPRRILGYQTPRGVFANLLADQQAVVFQIHNVIKIHPALRFKLDTSHCLLTDKSLNCLDINCPGNNTAA